MKQESAVSSVITIMQICSIAFLLNSCSEPNEKAHPAYQAAMKAFEQHNYPESAKKYEEYLNFNRSSSKTHLKLAKLYGDYLDNPFLEAYHYERYLVYQPDSTDKQDIQAWILAAKKNFARKIIKENPHDFQFAKERELKKLKESQRKLIEYMKQLKNEIAFFRKNKKFSKEKESPKKAKENVPSGKIIDSKKNALKSYTVKAGDNLSRISTLFFGQSKYYRLIYNANKDQMKSETDLRIGMKIKIPELKN